MPKFLNGCELSEITPSIKNILDENIFFGPTNYAHLSGTINGITKNIYLFMDTHSQLNEQTRCESFDSIDITYYLYQIIKKAKTPLDFFMEIRHTQLNTPITNKRDIYLKEVINLFKSEFVIEKQNDKNIVRYSKSNSNVRLHYLDIRDHFDMFYIIHMIQYDIFDNINLLIKNIANKKEYIDKILYYIKTIEELLMKLVRNKNEVLFNKQDNYDKNNKNEEQKYYFNKIINKYDNIILKEKITLFIEKHFNHIINKIIGYIIEVKPYIEYYDENNKLKIKENLQNIHDSTVDIYRLFVDAYLLRRVLDKNYVNDCIVYSGSQHSVNYMYFLIKYFDFKLLKIYNTIEKDIDKLITLIKNADFAFDIYNLVYLNEKIYLQCIQLNLFPRVHRGGNIDYFDFKLDD